MKPSRPLAVVELRRAPSHTSAIEQRLIRKWSQLDLDEARRYARHATASKDDPPARAWWRLASVRALAAARRMRARMETP